MLLHYYMINAIYLLFESITNAVIETNSLGEATKSWIISDTYRILGRRERIDRYSE